MMRWVVVVVVALGLGGCASTKPTRARQDVGTLIEHGGGPTDVVTPAQDAETRAAVDARIAGLLSKPLTLDRALRVALLGNRELRATLEDVGVAQADLVQAGLLQNPVIAGDLVVSTRGNGLGGGLSLSQSLLSAFLIPAKRRVAKANLRTAVVTVADAALELVRDVKVAHAELLAAVAIRDLHRTLVQTAEVADELAARQHEAGNLPDLERELFADHLDEARLELAGTELAATEARERVNQLLGLWGPQASWTLGGDLEVPPRAPVATGNLERLAMQQRLDVSAARAQVEALELAIALRRRGVVPMVDAGVEARNEVGDDEGHEWVIGPSLSLEIPIFDPGHADFARLRAHLRRAQHQLEHTAIVARSGVRTHRARLHTAGRTVDYIRDTVLPRQEAIGGRALERYNGMLIGTYELLELRERKARAHQAYVEARRDYFIAHAELERAVGGRLPPGPGR